MVKSAADKIEAVKRIVIIDNYDSFTYNLVHAVEKIVGHQIDVFKNDEVTIKEIENYEYIIISPGPGLPEESGLTLDIIRNFYRTKKIFGVCLGLQAAVVAFGGQLKNLDKVLHGIETEMYITERSSIYRNIETKFIAGRYHSWVADTINFPEELVINCIDTDKEIMGLHHKIHSLYAVQFHPESIMTPEGETMISNFLDL